MKRLGIIFTMIALLFSVFSGGSVFAKGNDVEHAKEMYQNELKHKQASFGSKLSKQKGSKLRSASQPELIGSNPSDFATNVPINQRITFSYFEKIHFANKSNIRLWDTSTFDYVSIDVEINNNTLSIIPKNDLERYKEYFAIVDVGAVAYDNGYANEYEGVIFTTSGNEAPIVKEISPYPGQKNVSTNPTITVTFDRSIKQGNMEIIFMDIDEKLIPVSAKISDNKLIITPSKALAKNQYYIFGIHTGSVKDSKNKENFDQFSFFSTGSSSTGGGGNTGNGISVSVEYKKTAKISIKGGKSPYTVASSNASVATATVKSNSITISGKKLGDATITVKDKNGDALTIDVKVIDYVVNF